MMQRNMKVRPQMFFAAGQNFLRLTAHLHEIVLLFLMM